MKFTKRSLQEHPPGSAGVADEDEIRLLARTGAKSRVWAAPPYMIAKLLDGNRFLIDVLDGEREKIREITNQNDALTEMGLTLSRFIFHARARGWITTHELEVLLDLTDDPETHRRLTNEG